MPSKIQLDENLYFLYTCLQKSDLKSIDFAAVGQATNLKPPAARMRYTRLRRQIESGSLIGTHSTPSPTALKKGSEGSKKRKLGTLDVKGETGGKKEGKIEGGEGREKGKEKGKEKEKEVVVKVEPWSEFDSSGEDSEDEVPLAKLRKARSSIRPVSGNGNVDGILKRSGFASPGVVGTGPPLPPNMGHRPLFLDPNWGRGDDRMWIQGGPPYSPA